MDRLQEALAPRHQRCQAKAGMTHQCDAQQPSVYGQLRSKLKAIEQRADHKNNRRRLHTRGDGLPLKGTGVSMAKLSP